MSQSKPTWDVLICSIEHRTDKLDALLGELERQLKPGVGVRVFRDNLETVYGDKCRALLGSSKADYVNFLDDDDWPADDYVVTILKALRKKPDYVGFQVDYTENGNKQVPVYHTTTMGSGWQDLPDKLIRDISHFNPIRRELALLGHWGGGDGADRRWADPVRASGHLKTEEYIDRELLHYRHIWVDGFVFSSTQAPLTEHPPRPDYDYVTWLS